MSEYVDHETGEIVDGRKRIHETEALRSYTRVETRRELFKRALSGEERRVAGDAATAYEMQRDEAKARGASEAKWVESALYSTDPVTRLAREEEAAWRKQVCGAEAKRLEALRMIELRAAANGFRWDEVETQSFADDYEFEVFTVRMDTLQEVSRRRMTEHEAKGAEERRQQRLFQEH